MKIIIDLRLLIIFCVSSKGIYLSLDISLSFSFVIFSGLFCCEFFETFQCSDIPLLYYFNLNSSIIFCLSSGNMYLFLGISLSSSFATISELFSEILYY